MSNAAARPAVSIGFRSRAEDGIWHFCENCPGWPDAPEAFNEHAGTLPAGSELCSDCLALRKSGNCRLRAATSGFSR